MKKLFLYIFLVFIWCNLSVNAEEKAVKKVTWQVFVKLTGEMGDNFLLPSFNVKETSKIKSVKDQISIVKKVIDKALYECEHSNIRWTISIRGNKICTLTVVKYFDEDNPNNNNKYVNLSGIIFDDLIITINGLEKPTPEKIEEIAARQKKLAEEIAARQKKLAEEIAANAGGKCDVSKPVHNWTMCIGTKIYHEYGFKYVGEFKDGRLHGQGTGTWANGEKYVGEFKVGMRHGQGTQTWSNGKKYVGEFKNDKRHGQGTLTLVNGKKKSGVWKNDELLTKKEAKTGIRNYVYNSIALNERSIFVKSDPTTFKKLTYQKERRIRTDKGYSSANLRTKNEKNFKGFSFIAEYENDIKLEIFIEYDKSIKDLDKAEKKALYFANMFGQMPHFLKIYTKKIFIHRDIGKDDGVWWAPYKKNEFHINESRCGNYLFSGNVQYSDCAGTMIHELAHVIKQYTSMISPSKWGQARKLDKKFYCSKYAKKNSEEDFAESVLCWIGVKYKSHKIGTNVKKIKKYIPNRLKFFDEMNLNVYPYKKEKN